jgi:hypothetical protein
MATNPIKNKIDPIINADKHVMIDVNAGQAHVKRDFADGT